MNVNFRYEDNYILRLEDLERFPAIMNWVEYSPDVMSADELGKAQRIVDFLCCYQLSLAEAVEAVTGEQLVKSLHIERTIVRLVTFVIDVKYLRLTMCDCYLLS